MFKLWFKLANCSQSLPNGNVRKTDTTRPGLSGLLHDAAAAGTDNANAAAGDDDADNDVDDGDGVGDDDEDYG